METTADHAASATQTLADLIGASSKCADLAAHLDALSSDERIRQCRALSGKQMARLYDLCAGAEPLTVDEMVPAALGEGAIVPFAGKNSLALFTQFEKHFARVGGAIIGINVQAMAFATGPGFYTCRAGGPGHEKEVVFDYTMIPASAPSGWPAPRSNARGLSHLVYKNLHDYNRKVSRDVVIGSATRLGKPIDSWYILARKS